MWNVLAPWLNGRCAKEAVIHELAEPVDQVRKTVRMLVEEVNELMSVYADHLQHYQANHEAAGQLIAIGESKADENLDPVELAAWTMVGNLVLNLDEVISKN